MSLVFRSPLLSTYKILDRAQAVACHPHLIKLSRNVAIVDIPKSGSSFIKSTIISAGLAKASISSVFPHSAIFSRMSKYSTLNHTAVHAFVRDPIERFCSVVREKLISNSLHPHGWSPYASILSTKRYDIKIVNDIVADFVDAPFCHIDKHLLPQSIFWSPYISLPSFSLHSVESLRQFFSEFGIDPANYASSAVSLVTDPALFSPSHLSSLSLEKLYQFYKSDYVAMRIINDQ